MRVVRARFDSIDGGQAALGQAGVHTVIADRPAGVAGGQGLGFNGAELLALALGGCFCNDLRYIAHRLGRGIRSLAIEVELQLDGDPVRAVGASLHVLCRMEDGTDGDDLIAEAQSISMVATALAQGVPVSVVTPR